MKNKAMNLLSFPYILWMAAFILIPLVIVAVYGFTSREGGFTTENVAAIMEPNNRRALWLSIRLSLLSTLFCFIMAYPLAMILNNLKIRSSGFIIMIFVLPMWMNFLLRTLAWQLLLEKNGVFNGILSFLGLPHIQIINTEWAIILGMVYNFLPFMVLPIYNSLIKIDKEVLHAARDLGANGFQTLLKVILPLTLPGVISGVTMVFVPALTTFVISDLLGGRKILLIGNVIEMEFLSAGNWHVGSGLSLVLMAFIVISMAIMSKYDKSAGGTGVW